MSAYVLVVNSGSSSVKFALMSASGESTVVSGIAEQLNTPDARIQFKLNGQLDERALEGGSHQHALTTVLDYLKAQQLFDKIIAVGHRVVHGGDKFKNACEVTSELIETVEALSPLAPLHNPPNVLGMRLCQSQLPNVPQVAVFDTAFHQTIPEYAYRYPVPESWYQDNWVRKYGFHGTSHRYISHLASETLQKPRDAINLISLHLGNGCSVCAIAQGKSVDTSMGLTPLAGVMMGTRSGDVDPGLLAYICQARAQSIDAVTAQLNRDSGLLAISQQSNDMRTLQAQVASGDSQAKLAIDMFCYRLAKTIASYLILVHPLDALVFTGGIGENDALVRAQVIKALHAFGYQLDEQSNREHGRMQQGQIQAGDSPVILVLATNEEKMIVQESVQVLNL